MPKGKLHGGSTSLLPALRRAAGSLLRLVPVGAATFILALTFEQELRLQAELGWLEIGGLATLLWGLLAAAARRFRRATLGAKPYFRDDVELSALLIAAAYATVQVGGAPLYPIVYLLMAFLVAFMPRWPGVVALVVALAFDAAYSLPGPAGSPAQFASHAAFLVLFAALYHAVLFAQVAANRASEKSAMQRRLREVDERARTYRLVSSGSTGTGAEDKEKWMLAAVNEIEGAVGTALEVAETALKTHTCAAFLLSSDDAHLKLHDCRSASECLQREPIAAGEGIFGGVMKRRAPMRMVGGVKGVSYYDKPVGVKSVLAVPVAEAGGAGEVRGVLVADRLTALPFTDDDERLLLAVAGQVLRAIEVERVMGYMKKARDENDRFFRAIEKLNGLSKQAEVFATALELVQGVAETDFCAATVVEEGPKRRHRVAKVRGVNAGKAVEGLSFDDNHGLVADVVRYGAPLPGRDVRQMERPVIFDEGTAIKGLQSLRILPLKVADQVLGTLVIGSRKKHAFSHDALGMLNVLASQVAQSILRAQLFEQTERMATTDGLTGLVNHRSFQTKLEESWNQAKRYGKKLSLLIVDVDHFKTINDTYGHPIGDLVLRGVAGLLGAEARATDVVARYGGEEFALIMPETDAKGAKVIAERIRKSVQKKVFDTECGPVKVTVSVGVATYPEAASEKHVFMEKADQCLYFAKRNGRNLSVTVAEMEAGRPRAAQA